MSTLDAQKPTARFHAELAWLGGERAEHDVLIEVRGDRIAAVTAGVPAPDGARRLRGLTMPGLVNSHSHVFHRAIRGHSQHGVGDFWAWREGMYDVAARLGPETLYALARATYAEMALSGITAVGEFFYLHHDVDPNGDARPYGDPNELGHAVVRAANDAGLRITLLDTCYLQGDVAGAELHGVQRRFSDGSWQGWAERVERLGASETDRFRLGAAIHSVRAVPRAALAPIAELAATRGWPLHVHLSEQPAENTECLAHHGLTPTALLDEAGVWTATATAVHATHLTADDIAVLGRSGTSIAMCPTTERDLADGVGPAVALAGAGSPLCVGSDAHSVIDLWEEARAVELDERLVSGRRGNLGVAQLAHALTGAGADSIGWDAGRIAEGALADLVTVALDTPRTAGARLGDALAHIVFAATAADVTDVVVGGRSIVRDGVHTSVPD
ncbi:MAG: formimidoylglutamate deiminase, partial [Mycobacteriaceae bacterium]